MKFSIRDLLLVTLIVALTLGWWLDHRRLVQEWRVASLKSIARLQGGLRLAESLVPNSSNLAPNPTDVYLSKKRSSRGSVTRT